MINLNNYRKQTCVYDCWCIQLTVLLEYWTMQYEKHHVLHIKQKKQQTTENNMLQLNKYIYFSTHFLLDLEKLIILPFDHIYLTCLNKKQDFLFGITYNQSCVPFCNMWGTRSFIFWRSMSHLYFSKQQTLLYSVRLLVFIS